jgi:hypothetical protein
MTAKFPILRRYRAAWPIHEIMKQFLGSQKSNFEKDTEAESNEKREPDREVIEAYLNSLPSQKTRIQLKASDDDREDREDSEEEDEEEGEKDDQEEEEVSRQDSRPGVKKSTLQKSKTGIVSTSESSKSKYLHDKTSTLNNPKAGPASTKTPQKTPRALTEKKHIEKENVNASKATKGKESKAHSPSSRFIILTLCFY